jgi:hypothetical protein
MLRTRACPRCRGGAIWFIHPWHARHWPVMLAHPGKLVGHGVGSVLALVCRACALMELWAHGLSKMTPFDNAPWETVRWCAATPPCKKCGWTQKWITEPFQVETGDGPVPIAFSYPRQFMVRRHEIGVGRFRVGICNRCTAIELWAYALEQVVEDARAGVVIQSAPALRGWSCERCGGGARWRVDPLRIEGDEEFPLFKSGSGRWVGRVGVSACRQCHAVELEASGFGESPETTPPMLPRAPGSEATS